MYRFPNNLTCKTELTVASDDKDFFDEIIDILQGSGSIESPVSVKKWSDHDDISLLPYTGILILHETVIAKMHPETLAQSISDVILGMTQTNDSMVMTQKILICKRTDFFLIAIFYGMHNVETDLDNPVTDIGYWSIFVDNEMNSPSFKPSHKHIMIQ